MTKLLEESVGIIIRSLMFRKTFSSAFILQPSTSVYVDSADIENLFLYSFKRTTYRITSYKRPGRLLNILLFRMLFIQGRVLKRARRLLNFCQLAKAIFTNVLGLKVLEIKKEQILNDFTLLPTNYCFNRNLNI